MDKDAEELRHRRTEIREQQKEALENDRRSEKEEEAEIGKERLDLCAVPLCYDKSNSKER